MGRSVAAGSGLRNGESRNVRPRAYSKLWKLVLSLSKDGCRWFDKLTMSGGRRTLKRPCVGPLRYSPPELSHGIFAAINFDKYILESSVYDEMFQPGGAPREHCQRLHETLSQLSVEELSSIQERVTRSFSNEGISFMVYGDEEGEERIIPVDCLPRVLSGAEWGYLETGLAQRVKALNLFLEDVYGEGRIIDNGVIPADMVYGCPQYRMEM